MASLYPFIKEDILKDIQSGVYQEDKMLPPEREFTEKYRVSRMTIRRALDELIQDGVLIRSLAVVFLLLKIKSHVVFLKYQSKLMKKLLKLMVKL